MRILEFSIGEGVSAVSCSASSSFHIDSLQENINKVVTEIIGSLRSRKGDPLDMIIGQQLRIFSNFLNTKTITFKV